MKFKNEKNTEEGQESRILTVTDKDGDTLTVRAYVAGKPQVIVGVTAALGNEVALSRTKALAFAWAIINELNPSMLA